MLPGSSIHGPIVVCCAGMSAAAVSLRICLQQAWRTHSLQRADRLRRKRPHGFTSRGEARAVLIRPRPFCRPALLACLLGGVGYLWAATSSATAIPAAPARATPVPQLVFRFSAPSPTSTIPIERTPLHMFTLGILQKEARRRLVSQPTGVSIATPLQSGSPQAVCVRHATNTDTK